MLTFWGEELKVEADRRVVERLRHFHRTRSQAFACDKMATAPKKPRQTLPVIGILKKRTAVRNIYVEYG